MSGCGTCLFYVPVKGPDGKPVAAGECRRHPPGLCPIAEVVDGKTLRAKWVFPHVPPDHPICGDYFVPPDPHKRVLMGQAVEPDALMSVPRGAWDFLQTRIAEASDGGEAVRAEERKDGPRLYDPDSP